MKFSTLFLIVLAVVILGGNGALDGIANRIPSPAQISADTNASSSPSSSQASSGDASDCKLVHKTVIVHLSRTDFPATVKHVDDAVRAGQPTVMHIARSTTDLHRSQSLKGIATKPGYDRDEYPMAMSREGGTGADVRLIPSSDNRGSGSHVGSKLRPYCSGQAFTLRPAN